VEEMTGVVLLKRLNSAHLALEEGVGSKTHIDPGGQAKRLKADALSIAKPCGPYILGQRGKAWSVCRIWNKRNPK